MPIIHSLSANPLNFVMDKPYAVLNTNGMTDQAMFNRYVDIHSDAIETEYWCSRHGLTPEYVAVRAKLNSLEFVMCAEMPGIPVFPWTPNLHHPSGETNDPHLSE